MWQETHFEIQPVNPPPPPKNASVLLLLILISGIIGVPSHDIVKYQPNAVGQFICRDGVLNISWSAVNDDYCDCNDGSDEPGTGACANTRYGTLQFCISHV